MMLITTRDVPVALPALISFVRAMDEVFEQFKAYLGGPA